MGAAFSGKAAQQGQRDSLKNLRESFARHQEVLRSFGLRMAPETAQELRSVGVEVTVEVLPWGWQQGLVDREPCPSEG